MQSNEIIFYFFYIFYYESNEMMFFIWKFAILFWCENSEQHFDELNAGIWHHITWECIENILHCNSYYELMSFHLRLFLLKFSITNPYILSCFICWNWDLLFLKYIFQVILLLMPKYESLFIICNFSMWNTQFQVYILLAKSLSHLILGQKQD